MSFSAASRLQPRYDGLTDSEHRPDSQGRRAVYLLVWAAKLHRRSGGLCDRAITDPDGTYQGGYPWCRCRFTCGRSECRGTSQAPRLCDRAIREEPLRNSPQRRLISWTGSTRRKNRSSVISTQRECTSGRISNPSPRGRPALDLKRTAWSTRWNGRAIAEETRKGFLYWSDDGDIFALRVGRWKTVFIEQNHEGLDIWRLGFEKLRMPKIFDLLADPFERADSSLLYDQWFIHHAYLNYGAITLVAEWLQSFKEFPTETETRELQSRRGYAAGIQSGPRSGLTNRI
jgi:hypothetical protein